MAVVSVTKIHNGRVSGTTTQISYRIEFDNLNNLPTDCYTATDPNTSLTIPAPNHSFSYSTQAGTVTTFLRNLDIQQDSQLVYIVTGTYTPDDQAGPEQANDAGNWGIDFSVATVPVVIDVGRDRDGEILTDTAGQPLQLKRTLYDEEITVTWKTLTPPASAITDCKGRINAAACSFTINGVTRNFATQTLKMTDGGYHTTTENGSKIWNVSLKFVEHTDTWAMEVPMVDRPHYLDDDGNLSAYDGTLYTLDEDGKQVTDPANAFIKTFWLDDEVDFAPLFAGL